MTFLMHNKTSITLFAFCSIFISSCSTVTEKENSDLEQKIYPSKTFQQENTFKNRTNIKNIADQSRNWGIDNIKKINSNSIISGWNYFQQNLFNQNIKKHNKKSCPMNINSAVGELTQWEFFHKEIKTLSPYFSNKLYAIANKKIDLNKDILTFNQECFKQDLISVDNLNSNNIKNLIKFNSENIFSTKILSKNNIEYLSFPKVNSFWNKTGYTKSKKLQYGIGHNKKFVDSIVIPEAFVLLDEKKYKKIRINLTESLAFDFYINKTNENKIKFLDKIRALGKFATSKPKKINLEIPKFSMKLNFNYKNYTQFNNIEINNLGIFQSKSFFEKEYSDYSNRLNDKNILENFNIKDSFYFEILETNTQIPIFQGFNSEIN